MQDLMASAMFSKRRCGIRLPQTTVFTRWKTSSKTKFWLFVAISRDK